MLVLRPPGRGNWAPVRVQIDVGRNSPRPLDYAVGQLFQLGAQIFRIVRVHA